MIYDQSSDIDVNVSSDDKEENGSSVLGKGLGLQAHVMKTVEHGWCQGGAWVGPCPPPKN